MNKKILLIIFDAEGLPRIKTWKDVSANFKTDKPTKKLINTAKKTIESVIIGAENSGFNKIIILDWHATFNNIPRKGIKKKSSTILKILQGNSSNFKSSLKKSSCAVLIGMHGKYKSADGKPPMSNEEFKKNSPKGLGHVLEFSIKNLYINSKSVGESVFLHNLLSEYDVPIFFVLGTRSAIIEIKKYNSKIRTLSNNCSYESIKNFVEKSLNQKLYSVKKPIYKNLFIEFKHSKNPNIDLNFILANRDEFVRMKSKKVIVKDRKIFFKPESKTPFLEIFYLMSLRHNYNSIE